MSPTWASLQLHPWGGISALILSLLYQIFHIIKKNSTRHTPRQCHPAWHLLIIAHKPVFQTLTNWKSTLIVDMASCSWTPQHIRVDHDQKVGVEAAWVITDSSSHPTYILRLTGLFIRHSRSTGSGTSSSITVTLAGNPDVASRIRCIQTLLWDPRLGGELWVKKSRIWTRNTSLLDSSWLTRCSSKICSKVKCRIWVTVSIFLLLLSISYPRFPCNAHTLLYICVMLHCVKEGKCALTCFL